MSASRSTWKSKDTSSEYHSGSGIAGELKQRKLGEGRDGEHQRVRLLGMVLGEREGEEGDDVGVGPVAKGETGRVGVVVPECRARERQESDSRCYAAKAP